MNVDHLVWYNSDPSEGARYFADRMDRPPCYGGVHPGEGTCNNLVSLGDSTYIEILSRDPKQSETSVAPELLALTSAGLYHWAASGADLDELREKVLSAGLEGCDIVTGGRTLPNGDWLGWKLFGLRNHGFGALVPFFIDWIASVHPASTVPRGGRLMRLEASSPRAKDLQRIYQILDLDIAVVETAAAQFSAIVSSASGEHALRMIDPIPCGYVI